MIRHVALFRLKDDAPQGARHSLEEGLAAIAQTIPQIAAYSYGADLGMRDGNFDFGVVADFENAEAFQSYVEHPDHRAFVEQRLSPVVDERVSIQFTL
ncbi:MAG: stress protein [Deltaproteobacteria bacterium]|jgi:hypothetical protein|nr:stress protein [Deltaproteobacteria bacterium]